MHIGRLARAINYAALVLLMITGSAVQGRAQDHDGHGAPAAAAQKLTQQQNDLVRIVREATERFRHVTDPTHDGDVNANEPEIVLFEPTRNGGIRVTGADFLVFKAEWDTKHKGEGPPSLNGQLFHLFDSPNRFGLDPFYTLHVWAWKENPNGTFTNWNPNVSCDAFNPKTSDEQ
jgi:hypothetical protein